MPQYCHNLSERGDESLTDFKRDKVPKGADRSYNFPKNPEFSKNL